jgi:hypothetical protein
MQTADFNHEDFDQSAQNKLDEQLLVKFFVKQVQDKTASLSQGRPIFKDVEYVDIKIPGNRTGGACRPATHRDKQRFYKHYEMFKARIEAPVVGTPLSEWPLITRTRVEELAYLHVKTVEQLVDLSDTHAGQIMGIHELKKKAKDWLEKADDTARINEIESLKDANAQKDERINSLEGQLMALAEKVNNMSTNDVVTEAAKPKPKPRKRTASKQAKV